jgi:hypothetical protein
VNVCKVCIDEGLSFISESLGEISLFSYQHRSAGEAQSRERCAQASESLRTYQPRRKLKDYYCKDCTGRRLK